MTRREDSEKHARIAERLRDIDGVRAALREARKRALLEHARAGREVPVWRDNRVIWEVPRVAEDEN